MNVALVTHNVIKGDGQGRVNYELARHLLQCGASVDLYADQVADELLDEGATWHPIHPEFEEIILLKVWRFKRIANRHLAQSHDQYDIILGCGVTLDIPHTHNAAHFVHGPWLDSPYHAARVESGLRSWYQWLFTALNARWERSTFARADEVIAVSEMVRDELIEIGIPRDAVHVINNGVDLDEFSPGQAARPPLGLPEDVVLGLFVGDLESPIKNLDGVLHALADIPGVHLAVAGSVGQSPYPSLAHSLGIGSRVHFLDYRRDITDLMRAADFFTLPSRRDSCPLVLLEAMASGLPTITATTVGNSNLVSDDSGFVLNGPDDQQLLKHALRVLRDHPDRRHAMGQAARATAEQHGWRHMTEQYRSVFEAYLRRRSTSSELSTTA
jgi:glycosyltransferase involved in cell wall biosynthesis